jgi:molybdopterin converting factor small subunit
MRQIPLGGFGSQREHSPGTESMRITVKFMSQIRVLAGRGEAVVELPEGATVADLFGLLRETFSDIFPVAERAIVMVNHKIVALETALDDGDQVMLLQLLGGG